MWNRMWNVGKGLGQAAACVRRRQSHRPQHPLSQSARKSSSGGKGDDGASSVENDKSILLGPVGNLDSGKSKANASEHDPVHFPWRHEPSPPARFLEKDDLSGMPNNFRARLLRRILACRELNMTPIEALPLPFGFSRQWEEELAGNFAIAFGLGLEELLKSLFQDALVKNEFAGVGRGGEISLDSSEKNKKIEVADTDCEYLKSMFDKDLISIFQSVNLDNLHLKLCIRPLDATLKHIFMVPLLSREIVGKKPHLKGGYRRIERLFAERKSADEVKRMTFELANEIGHDSKRYPRTVIADATIMCSEFYQVKDAISGALIQGMEDDHAEEDVVHNVRFEVVTEKSEDGNGRMVGRWKVSDIDDLLNGNVFH